MRVCMFVMAACECVVVGVCACKSGWGCGGCSMFGQIASIFFTRRNLSIVLHLSPTNLSR